MTHIPVLSRELITGLDISPDGLYLDATVGFGGHSRLILESGPDVRVIALDQDQQALNASQTALAEYGSRIKFCHINFAEYQPDPETMQEKFDGIIADIGVSSVQIDTPERGFSFRHAAPLDMRMNQSQTLTAEDIVNYWQETELANIFFTYGEERLSRRIARQIVNQRPFQTTTELAEAIAQSVPAKYRHGRIHPATRVFQALRIAVNEELKVLERFLAISPNWLKNHGRIGIISFHSLEDRLVKHSFKDNPNLKVITKKPIQPEQTEISHNPRARSAKLRMAEKVADQMTD
jgi:16S rRNA (cytosine1402-N4)-methyltransferase